VKLPAPRGGGSAVRQCFAARKGRHLFQIASLNPALKGGVKGSQPVMAAVFNLTISKIAVRQSGVVIPEVNENHYLKINGLVWLSLRDCS
jgi:hypothetical protein